MACKEHVHRRGMAFVFGFFLAALGLNCILVVPRAHAAQTLDEAAEARHEAYADAAAKGLYAEHEPDANGHISHRFHWMSPSGANVSLAYDARARPGVLRLTLANTDSLVIVGFEPVSAAGAGKEEDGDKGAGGVGPQPVPAWLTLQTSSDETENEVVNAKFIVSSRPLADASAVRLQHNVAAVERLGSGRVRLSLVPVSARDMMQEVHAHFVADDLREVYRMHAAYQARAAGGARLRRSVKHYDKEWDPSLASWNYDSSNSLHWDKALYDLYPSSSALDVECSDCYYSARMPVDVKIDWGPGNADFVVSFDISLVMDLSFDVQVIAKEDYTHTWTHDLLDLTLGVIPIFSFWGIGINLEPELILTAELDVTLAEGFTGTAGIDAHFSKRAVVTLDTRDDHDHVSHTSYAAQFKYNRHPVSAQHVDGKVSLRLIPELRLNLDHVGWVGIKASPGLNLEIKTGGMDGNDCSSPSASQLTAFVDVKGELEAQVIVGFSFASWKSDVYTYSLPTVGPYNLVAPICAEPPSRRRRQEQDASGTFGHTDVCKNATAARPVDLGQRITINTCDTSDTSVWEDTVHSQCHWQDPTVDGENGPASTMPAAHLVLRSETGHYLISTEDADGQNSSALVQVRLGSCCGPAAGCQANPTTLHPQEVVLSQADQGLHFVVSRTDGKCGPVTVQIKRDLTPRFFVDCRVAGTDANATGELTSPYGTVARAVEAVAARHAASPAGAGAGHEFPAVVTLLPDLGAGCFHALPVGYRMPAALRGVHLTLTSLNGEKTTAMSLYDAHLRRCGSTAARDGTIHTCLTDQQFMTMARGTAYDTRLQPPPSASSASGNGSDLALVGTGAGFVIDAGERLTFRGLGFYNFATAGNGGSIRSSDAEVAVENCMFIASMAGGKGGGIYVQGGSVTVVGSVAVESRAAEGGFLAAEDGAGVSVYGSLLAHGDAGVGGGGGLLVRDSRLTLAATELIGNSAETRGGGLCVEGELASAGLDGRVSFTANDAGRYGGAMAAATGATITSTGGARLERNVAGLAGGAVTIMGEGSRWEDANSELDGNAAPAIYTLGGGHIQLTATTVRHSSPVGTSNGYLTPRPGALLCAHGSVQFDSDTQLTDSFDMYANPMNNIGCVDCDGCANCGECGLCGRCTSEGCDADYGARKCVAVLGAGATCSEVSGHCQPPSAVSTTSTASGTDTTTTTTTGCNSASNSASTGGAGAGAESGSGGVHRGYRSATYALSALLAVALAVLAAVLARGKGTGSRRRAGGYKQLSYAMYESDNLHDASAAPVVADIVHDSA